VVDASLDCGGFTFVNTDRLLGIRYKARDCEGEHDAERAVVKGQRPDVTESEPMATTASAARLQASLLCLDQS
jgi:hypothetical protein